MQRSIQRKNLFILHGLNSLIDFFEVNFFANGDNVKLESDNYYTTRLKQNVAIINMESYWFN